MAKRDKKRRGFENHVVIYLRYSTKNQTDLSIEYQREKVERYCALKGYTIVKEFVDEAKSATTDKRGAFLKMIEEAHNEPPWSKIVVFSFNRFARNKDLDGYYKVILSKQDIVLESATEDNSDTPEGRLARNLAASYDAYMPDRCAVHTHAAMETKARKCLHCGGKPPLGFDVKDEKLVVNPYEAETVRLIFDMYNKNYSYNDMIKVLNEQGRTTKKKKPFKRSSFHSILHQEKYKGTYVWNRASRKKIDDSHNNHESKPLEEQVRIEDGCEAIIDAKTFDMVQMKMSGNRLQNMRSVGRHHYAFGGMGKIQCSECGAFMIGSSYKSHDIAYRYYVCPNHRHNGCATKNLRASYIEHVVCMIIANKVLDKNNYGLYNSIFHKDFGSKSNPALNKELSETTRAINNILNVLETNPGEEAKERLDDLCKKKQAIKNKLAEKEYVPEITDENIAKIRRAFFGELKNSPDPTIYDILYNAIDKITVSNDEIQIELNI